MKELLRKKSVKTALLLIILLVAAGIIGFNAQSAQRQNEYDNHIKAAEKYLTELDYEQAIAEYILAYEIEPSGEVLDALEQTYIAYAQSYADTGDYERAIAILEEGYAQIGRESLRERMEEVQTEMETAQRRQQEEEEQRRVEEERQASGMVEFPFSALDITVMGYSISENHIAEIRALFPTGEGSWAIDANPPIFIEPGTDESRGYYSISSSTDTSGTEHEDLWVNVPSGGNWGYLVDYTAADTNHTGSYVSIQMTNYDDNHTLDYAGINVPVRPGASYEEWCEVMQINHIKEYDIRAEQRDDMVGIWDDDYAGMTWSISDGGEYWLFSTEELKGVYSEVNNESGNKFCTLIFARPKNRLSGWSISRITANISDGVVVSITYGNGFLLW